MKRIGPKLIVPNLHTPSEIARMREAGKLTAQCLREVGALVAPGVTTKALDDAVKAFCDRHGVKSAALNYLGFPAHCCTSVNHVVAHGIPNERLLQEGDIVKIDVALRKDGWHGDTCATFPVGWVNVKSRMLIDVTRTALEVGIKAASQPDATVGDIGAAIYDYCRTTGFTVVEELFGHGIGRELHALPDVPHRGTAGSGSRLVPGMCITIEPMINAGQRFIKTLDTGAIVTRDRQRSAQFEHTIAITENGVEILTL